MAGIVIIDNEKNMARQIGETATSWVLRTGAYAAANAINLAIQQKRKHGSKDYGLTPAHIWSSELATLKKKYPDRDYRNMPFLVGDIPANNIILKNSRNELIEFVNAKIRVTKENTIIPTALVNRRGAIKEYITAKDYVINIAGDIMVGDNSYPAYEAGEVNSFLDEPEEFDIVNVLLEELGISKVVFNSGDFDQQGQKFFNILPFKFQFTSDNDAENAYDLIMDN